MSKNPQHRTTLLSLKSISEIMVRSAFTIIYIIVWIVMVNHFVTFEGSDHDLNRTTVVFYTSIAGGLVSYTIGISLAMACVVMTRSVYNRPQTLPDLNDNTSPPPDAKESPTKSTAHRIEDTDPPMMQILEEQIDSILSTPLLQVSRSSSKNSNDDSRKVVANALPFWKVVFAFQCGLLSIVFVIPSFYLPVIELQYDNDSWIYDLMQNRFRSIALYHIPLILYTGATRIETSENLTSMWMFGLIIGFLVVSIVLCPLYAIVMAVRTWMMCPSPMMGVGETRWTLRRGRFVGRTRDECLGNLYMIHPAIGGIVLAVSLFLSAKIMNHWNFIGSATSWICQTLPELHPNHCAVRVSSSLQIGAWCYLVQSILLEVFIIATLKWS